MILLNLTCWVWLPEIIVLFVLWLYFVVLGVWFVCCVWTFVDETFILWYMLGLVVAGFVCFLLVCFVVLWNVLGDLLWVIIVWFWCLMVLISLAVMRICFYFLHLCLGWFVFSCVCFCCLVVLIGLLFCVCLFLFIGIVSCVILVACTLVVV